MKDSKETTVDMLAYEAENNFNHHVKSLRRRVNCIADAEDIVQDAFEKGIKYAGNCKEGMFQQWFKTIINNSWKDWKNKERLGGMTVQVNEKNGGYYDCMEDKNQLARIISNKIATLPQSFKKDVLYRRYCMGLSIKDISNVLDADKERVRKCLLRWRKEIKTNYGVNI